MNKAVLLTLTVITLIGCGGGGSGSSKSDTSDNKQIQGLWSLAGGEFEATGYKGTGDERYLHIQEGRLTIYDYKGDSFDQGDNCYVILSGSLVSKGGDNYEFRVFGSSSSRQYSIENSRLIERGMINYEDSSDRTPYHFIYERSELSISDFSPDCASK